MQQFLRFIRLVSNYLLELQTKVREEFKITEKSPTRASSWLIALSHLRHYEAKQASTHVDVKLGRHGLLLVWEIFADLRLKL